MVLPREFKNVGCNVLLACSWVALTGIYLNEVSIVFSGKTSLHAHEDEFFPEKNTQRVFKV